MFIKIKKEHELAIIPKYQTDGAAAVDLHSVESVYIESGDHAIVSTGLSMEIPPRHVGLIFPRSGNAAKYGITLSNAVAVIDSDFRNNIKILLHNTGDKPYIVDEGDRVAQFMCIPYPPMVFIESDDLSETKRGKNGLGSTGY